MRHLLAVSHTFTKHTLFLGIVILLLLLLPNTVLYIFFCDIKDRVTVHQGKCIDW